MSIGESTVRISRLQRKVIKSCEGLLGDTTKFPDDEIAWNRRGCEKSGKVRDEGSRNSC